MRNHVRIAAVTAASALLALGNSTSGGAQAGPAAPVLGVWRPVGSSIDGTPAGQPSGLAGRVSAVLSLPGQPVVEVVGTLGGIWEKPGSGAWQDVTGTNWPSTAIGSLAVDPKQPSVLYAGTGYDDIDDFSAQPGAGVLKSSDGGRTWAPLAASESLMRGYAVTGLAVDPVNDHVVVAAANNGVFRSPDGGRSWHEALAIPANGDGIAEVHLAVDPATGVMLAGVAESGGFKARLGAGTIHTGHAVFRSTDGGRSWRAFALDGGSGAGLVVAPGIATARGRTYAYALDVTGGRASGIYTSADGGRSWRRQVGGTETKASIGVLAVDPKFPAHAYFAVENGPYQYTWGSHRFSTITAVDGSAPQFGDWRALSIGPVGGGTRALYGGFDGGTCFYDFATKTFTNNDAGLVSGLQYFGAARSSTLEVSGAQDLGIQAYGGGSIAQEVFDADAYGVLIDRNDPNTYYASAFPATTSAAFVVSHDAGATWASVVLPAPASDVYSMLPVQAAGAPNVLILPEQDGTLFVSTNDGKTWKSRSIRGLAGDYVVSVAAALIPHTAQPVIYVGTGFGALWRSSDLGATWSSQEVAPMGSQLSVMDVLVDPSTSTGPGGEHVILALGIVLPQAYAQSTALGGVLESSDSGQTWTDITGALSSTSVNTLLLDGSTLLAGTDNGVEQYVGGVWSAAGSGFPDVRVTDLFASSDQSAIFATTYGRGVLEVVITPPPVGGGRGPSRPGNLVAPWISGVPRIGHTLTVSVGRWSGSPRPRYQFQWQRCRARCVDIAGATKRVYTLVDADRGGRVRVLVRATNSRGSRRAASAKVPVRAGPVRIGNI
jgi:photosystem II stability/assembly factor-like uncharacterized protein